MEEVTILAILEKLSHHHPELVLCVVVAGEKVVELQRNCQNL